MRHYNVIYSFSSIRFLTLPVGSALDRADGNKESRVFRHESFKLTENAGEPEAALRGVPFRDVSLDAEWHVPFFVVVLSNQFDQMTSMIEWRSPSVTLGKVGDLFWVVPRNLRLLWYKSTGGEAHFETEGMEEFLIRGQRRPRRHFRDPLRDAAIRGSRIAAAVVFVAASVDAIATSPGTVRQWRSPYWYLFLYFFISIISII